jgi:phosphate/sulfate permease
MKKIISIGTKIVGLYLFSWIVAYVVSVTCGAPADVTTWSTSSRIVLGAIAAPIVGFTFAAIAEQMK